MFFIVSADTTSVYIICLKNKQKISDDKLVSAHKCRQITLVDIICS